MNGYNPRITARRLDPLLSARSSRRGVRHHHGPDKLVRAPLRTKIATEPWEFDAIQRLNHRTFAEEIPQHRSDPSGRLVDKFHDENRYVICIRDRQLLGMVAVRGTRPFSLDQKLPDLDSYLPAGRRICELRLLAVEKGHRAGRLLSHLLGKMWRYCLREGYDVAVISAATRQLKLYRHLGFESFGPIVGSAGAEFQPMMLTLERVNPRAARWFRDASLSGRDSGATPVTCSFLPGPVAVRPDVQQALLEMPDSHRSPSFGAGFESTRAMLCHLAAARHVEILLGSGTLANDAIAAQLSLQPGPGVILSNGEFGDRLVDHAARFRLACEVMQWPWGRPFDLGALDERLSNGSPPRWLWFAHVETSTGALNELDAVATLCGRVGTKVCVDAISSFGTLPLDLRDIYFASAVSGKGLGAFAGLAMVFYNHAIASSAGKLPRYLDLELYAQRGGVPFTQSSNLLRALETSLARIDWPRRFRILAERSTWLRTCLRKHGFELVAPDAHAAPGVVTIALPAAISSAGASSALQALGYTLASNSEYLRQRNWIQIGLMGQPSVDQLRGLVDALHRVCSATAAS